MIVCLTTCTSKDQVYEGVYEGLKMSKGLEDQQQGPSEDKLMTDDEKLPEYDQYKNRRKEILKKNK